MHVSDSSAMSWLDIAQTMEAQQDLSSSWQDETVDSGNLVADPICLFGQFVSAVSSNTIQDIQPQSTFSVFIRDLCAKAPSIAQYLAQEILNHPCDESQPEVQGSTEHGSGTNPKRSTKRKRDSTYRLPRSSRAQLNVSRDKVEDGAGSPLVYDSSDTYQSGRGDMDITQSNDSLVTEKPLQECERDIPEIIVEEGVQGLPSTQGCTIPSIGSESAVHQLKATYGSDSVKGNTIHRNPLEILFNSTDVPGDGAAGSHGGSNVDHLVSDDAVTCLPADDDMAIKQSNTSLTTKNAISTCEEGILNGVPEDFPPEGIQGHSAAHGHTMRSIPGESVLHQAAYSCDSAKGNAVHQRPLATLDGSTEDSQTTLRPPSESEVEQQTLLIDVDGKPSGVQTLSAPSLPDGAKPLGATSPDSTPSTPIRQIGREFQSSPSDDQTATPQSAVFTPLVNREVLSPLTELSEQTASPPQKVELILPGNIQSILSSTAPQQTSLCNTVSTPAQQVNVEQRLLAQDTQAILPSSALPKIPKLVDMVAQAVHVLYEMSSRQEIPTKIHSGILSTLRSGLSGTPTTAAMVDRPDSTSTTGSSTIWSASMWISMLEASDARAKETTILNMIEWMGASEWYDAELEQAEKVPPLTKRGKRKIRVATVVLDKYLKEICNTTATEGPENLTLKDDNDRHPSCNLAGIQTKICHKRRRQLINTFHKGRTLRRLVRMTHLGILFDPDIWSYAKSSKETIDKIASLFQADSQKMELLSILNKQVELLAEEGRPDLSRFFNLLESRSIIPSAEVSILRAEYGLEREPMPQGCLDNAIDRVVEEIDRVLGKRPRDQADSVLVNGTIELPYSMFDRLRSKAWLKCWDIAAALDMADRPASVKLGLSVPLHEEDANGDITPYADPLGRWREQIDEYRCQGKTDLGVPQVYLCPLNLHANHFTLLEINEQTKMIYHYDSMANQRIISRKTKITPVRRVVEKQFKYLGFIYTEAPTPQQKDGWSCGLMVIRNAKRRMMGLKVGTWEDEVDPDRVIKEVIGDCQTFLEQDDYQLPSLSKKRKIMVGDIESSSKT